MRHRKVKLISRMEFSGLFVVLFALVMAYVAEFGYYPDLPTVSVDYPKAAHAKKMPGAVREDALLISITRDGKMFFRNDQMDPASLPGRIRKSVAAGSPPKAYMKVDARARYGNVLQVLPYVRSGGVQDVAFLVEDRKP